MSDPASETSEFPRDIGKVARRELALNGFIRYEQLAKVTKDELLAIHGIGPKSIRFLEAELAERGSGFRED